MNRRDFFKKAVLGGFAAGLTGILQSSAEGKVLNDNSEWQEPKWKRTIYFSFDNQKLESLLLKTADEIGCEAIYGEGPDILIMMSRCFTSVVDRSLIDEATWYLYIECCNENKYAPVTLIVDADEELQRPRNSYDCNMDEFINDPDFNMDTGAMMEDMIKWEKDRITGKGEKIIRLAEKIIKA